MEELVPHLLEYVEGEDKKLTEENYIKARISQEQISQSYTFDDCPMAMKVDVTGRDITHCDNLDKALCLTRSSGWTYERILEKVLPLDVARDEKFARNGGREGIAKIWEEIGFANDNDKDTKEEKELKTKRRSSLIETKSWRKLDLMRRIHLKLRRLFMLLPLGVLAR